MRAAFTAVLVSAVALSVAACKPKPEDARVGPGAEAPAGSPAAPSAPSATKAESGALPSRQPGLWETSISVKGEGQPVTSQMCLDAATEARQSIWGGEMSRDMCEKYEMKRQADGSYAFNSTCNLGSGGVTRSQGRASGDLTSNYTISMKSTTSGAELEMMNRDQEFTVASRRLGACKPGQRGGDMFMHGRLVANVNDLPGMAPKGKK